VRHGVWQESGGHGGVGNLSGYFAAVAPLFPLAMAATRSRKVRWGCAAVLLAILLAALAGRQRMLWPIFVVQLALGVALAQRAGLARLSRRTLVWGLAGTLVAATLALMTVQAWRLQTRQTVPLSEDVRGLMWPKVVDRILEEPLVGAGLGRQAMRKAHPDLVREKEYFWHAHNVFLNAGISMGVPGVAALLWLFIAFLAAYARLLRAADARARWIGIAGILMITGVVGRNLTNDFFMRDGALLFWALNGALLGSGLRAAAWQQARAPSPPPQAGEGQGGGPV
jgi:O-antigen ligase